MVRITSRLNAPLGDKNYLGTRYVKENVVGDYVWLSYNDVARRVHNLAAGLDSLNIAVQSNVGLYSVNRLEWTLGEFACYSLKYNISLFDIS